MIQREKWEYLTTFLYAHVDNENAMIHIQQNWPGWKPAKYAPETLIPELNNYGAEGWELVHMQPIGAVGKNQDVGFIAGDAMARWSNSYFCVFKRLKA
jgi:hypothetical protein